MCPAGSDWRHMTNRSKMSDRQLLRKMCLWHAPHQRAETARNVCAKGVLCWNTMDTPQLTCFEPNYAEDLILDVSMHDTRTSCMAELNALGFWRNPPILQVDFVGEGLSLLCSWFVFTVGGIVKTRGSLNFQTFRTANAEMNIPQRNLIIYFPWTEKHTWKNFIVIECQLNSEVLSQKGSPLITSYAAHIATTNLIKARVMAGTVSVKIANPLTETTSKISFHIRLLHKGKRIKMVKRLSTNFTELFAGRDRDLCWFINKK